MVIYEDTRQKLGKHKTKNKYWLTNNIKVLRQALFVGDYVLEPDIDKCTVSIDTKQNLLELVCDMWCDAARFQKECQKAKINNIKLIFLIEEKLNKEELLSWQSRANIQGKKYINVSGKQVYYKMIEYVKLYGCMFRFCHKNSTGRMVVELLHNNQK